MMARRSIGIKATIKEELKDRRRALATAPWRLRFCVIQARRSGVLRDTQDVAEEVRFPSGRYLLKKSVMAPILSEEYQMHTPRTLRRGWARALVEGGYRLSTNFLADPLGPKAFANNLEMVRTECIATAPAEGF